jgi:hypothetical protein
MRTAQPPQGANEHLSAEHEASIPPQACGDHESAPGPARRESVPMRNVLRVVR